MDDSSGLKVKINYDKNKSIKLVFGRIDIPRNSDQNTIAGVAMIARRYIRIIDKTDSVYLASISLIDLSSSPSLWANDNFIRIPSFKRVIIKDNDKEIYDISRDYMYGPLLYNNKNEKLAANTFSCFEDFLKGGQFMGLAQHNEALSPGDTHHRYHLYIYDFLGLEYAFQFGIPILPTDSERSRQAMQVNFIHDGLANKKVPFTMHLKIKNEKPKLDSTARTLREYNIEVSKKITNRLIYLNHENYVCLSKFINKGIAG